MIILRQLATRAWSRILSSIRGKYIIPFVISLGLVGKAGTPASSSGLMSAPQCSTKLSIQLIVAGVRAALACELMAIPGLLFGKHTELACLLFSPSRQT